MLIALALTVNLAFAQPSNTPKNIQPNQKPAQQVSPPQQQLQQQIQQQPQLLQQQVNQPIQQQTYQGKRSRSNEQTQTKSTEELIKALPRQDAAIYETPQIQIAILLDVSGSMNGLINQARAELWKVVNTFNGVTQKGTVPEVRVALYSYGTSKVGDHGLYLNKLVPLTTDLDRISEVLFALKTSGSAEFCGSSILAAAWGQAWSASPTDLKAMIIAGNESFLQGPITPQKAFTEAGARGIITHTIHCGSPAEGIKDGWRKGAKQGEGQFMNINHNAKEEYIPTPFDDQLEDLNSQLNDTYIPYGRFGSQGRANHSPRMPMQNVSVKRVHSVEREPSQVSTITMPVGTWLMPTSVKPLESTNSRKTRSPKK